MGLRMTSTHMIPKELFQKVRRIQITTSRLVSDIFAGQYHSVFKGRGMEFDEVREYQLGDDIRTIDWNVTARTGHVFVKKYVEERELTVMLMVDVSFSCRFATVNQLKSKLAAEIASVLAFSAIRNNDKVGLIIFTDKIEKFIPPRKGVKNVLRVIREVLYFEPQHRSTNISQALEFLSQVSTRKNVAFLISDFFEPVNPAGKSKLEPNYKKAMAIANRRHDLIAITLNDPREKEMPACGLVTLKDAETGQVAVVDTLNAQVRERYHRDAQERINQRSRIFRSIGMDHVDVATDVPYADALVKFFLQRRKRGTLGSRAAVIKILIGMISAGLYFDAVSAMAQEIRDVKPPVTPPSAMPFILGSVIGTILLGLLIRYVIEKRKLKTAAVLTPYQFAQKQLAELQAENWPAQGRMKEFYTRLSTIIRHYLERQMNVRAREMTTEEFFVDINKAGVLDEEQKNALKNFMDRSDLVKFAKYGSSTGEAEESLALAERFIDEIQQKADAAALARTA